MKRLLLPLFILGMIFLGSCRKEQDFVRQSVDLRFSADTIFLDTVFTQVGSSTRTLRVFNPTNEDVYIDRISLGRGNASYYRLNVNGTPTKNITDVELLAKDSITIRIEVTADVGLSNEILYTDSIIFNTLGNIQDVDLVTLARDAHFYYPTNVLVIPQPEPFPDIRIPYSVLDCNSTWAADKPHVVYGYAVVDSGCVLNVQPGVELHFHSQSGLWVTGGGQLLMDGGDLGNIDSDPIVVQGDRLEPFYENVPGQWGGILGGIFIQSGSTGNVIRNTIIKNATTALRVDSTTAAAPNLLVENAQVLNSSRVGIYGGYANVQARNVVVGNSGVYGLYALGGNYDFIHCTFANYSVGGRSTPSIGLFNYFETSPGTRFVRDIESAQFENTIVYGNRRVEFGVGLDNAADLNFQFVDCFIRLEENPIDNAFDREDQNLFTNCTLDTDPRFEDFQNQNYQLDSISPALDVANPTIAQGVPNDIVKVSRVNNPDVGAYERQ
ncbi:right-handed parallel beta-helix repeat-containing protein [Phaeocystidibacter luteus]|uniref:Right-handed parallel beta-helix repeat-containing protein n=1 Tax=Phaeocystidibacter luteus TaxID=911197 RepID=A0A6N6RD49_9FLAO|nr:right-handed parallel beta-helix repeat-containing protein [Phaeocystidibacter luteus]KAB2806795.1 right-handed parallel beta-helix repeat-containing protein [Phaeocystidibacter luteus]